MPVLRLVVLAFFLCAPVTASAVEPDEVLDDPALETRARDLSSELRCLVCQNQSIDDSDAELAKDLRVLVRERLVAGDSDAEVMDFVVDRYGEFVLLKPRFSMRTALLWITPILVLLISALSFFAYVRRSRNVPAEAAAPLSAEEEARITKILDERD